MKNQEKNNNKKKTSYVIWIVVCLLVIILLAFGLWLLWQRNKAPEDTLVFKVGNQNVYLDEVNLYCLENVAQLGITVEQLNTVVAQDGTAAPDYYKQEIFDLILDNKVTYMKALEEGITLTKQEQEAINSDAVAYIGSLNGSVTKRFGITMDTVKRSYEERYIVKKYGEKLFSEITVEEQRYATLYLLLFPKVQIDENGNYVTDTDGETPILLSEDKIKKAKEDADAALIELKNGADIAEVAKKYGVDLVSGEESNLVGSFSDPFKPYAETLKNGELSPVLDIKSCYAIVQMMSENNEEIARQITNYYMEDTKQEKMKEALATWYQEYEIEKDDVITGSAWDKLSLYDFSQYVEE